MRKLAVILALASTALASPALARDKAWYVGVDGGAMLVEDIHYNIGTVQNAAASDHKYGYDADGNIGYDFGPFRVEAEVAYKSAVVSGYRTSIGGAARFNSNGTYTPVNAGSYGAGGRATALSFMVNGLLDFGDSDTIQGFVGGGVGVARVKDRLALSQYGSFLNDSDTVFAYQGLAGIRAPLTPHLDATLKYRFFNAQNVRLVDVTNRAFNDRFRSHSILGGISYNFGEPPAPPPPPPVVAPPPPPPPPVETPPPPPPVCSPGPFIVFFEWNKSDITPEASSILDNAVSSYQTCNGAQVMVAGYTDRSGTAQYNVGLSQRRATAVKNYFAAHGVSDGVIQTQAFGETHPRVDTADGVREVQNRRVEITYGPGSGQ